MNCCDDPPIALDIIQNAMKKGPVYICFRELKTWGQYQLDGYEHHGQITEIRCGANIPTNVLIEYLRVTEGASRGFMCIFADAFNRHAQIRKRGDGHLELVDDAADS